MFNYPAESREAMRRLEVAYGLTPPCRERIGAFIVYCAMFENFLEKAIWAVKGEDPADKYPSTDNKPVSALIETYRAAAPLRPALSEVITLTSDVAENLVRYRNAIAHGLIMPGGNNAWFLTNTRWHGENRKKQSQDAHADENFLDLAVFCASTIARAVVAVFFAITQQNGHSDDDALAHLDHLKQARSMAYELRHHSAMFRSEKY